MPHKHRRDKTRSNASFYELPPSKIAHSLPVTKDKYPTKAPKPTRRKERINDDTPRAFTRLLAPYRPPRSGLDDGRRPLKKRNVSAKTTEPESSAQTQPLEIPRIQHNEPLSAFAARVNAALPFAGIRKKAGGEVKGVGKERQTKTEKKMQRMQKEWREEDRKRQEKVDEEADDKDVDEEGVEDMGEVEVDVVSRKGKKSKRKRRAGDQQDDDDPWAEIGAKRKQVEGANVGLIGLHDVVQAPPKLTKAPKGKENMALASRGGLKMQAELGMARQSVVEGYRAMMREKRTA